MSRSHLSEEQEEHSRRRTECIRLGAKREHCIFEELHSVPCGWGGDEMSL